MPNRDELTPEQFLSRLDGVRKSCAGWMARCPAHEDRNPSLSIDIGRDGKILVLCRAGCDTSAVLAALGLSLRDLCGGTNGNGFRPIPAHPEPRKDARRPLMLPRMSEGTDSAHAALAALRHVAPEAVKLLVDRGLVRFAELKGRHAWLVLDSARVNVQARRMDGKPWAHIHDAKAWTLPGSRAVVPVGLPEAADFPRIALVEGGPDMLAASHFMLAEGVADKVAPVALLGACNRIPDKSLPAFRGKYVRLFPHTDEAGQKAAGRWVGQLRAAGAAKVDAFDLTGLEQSDGRPVGDLNDLCAMDAGAFEADADLRGMMP